MSAKHSIYLADRHCGGYQNKYEWYHACLMWVDEDAQQVRQQLHFNNLYGKAPMMPHVEEGLPSAYTMKMFEMRKRLEGDEAFILSGWNHMLKYAAHIRQNFEGEVLFDEDFMDDPRLDTINCRAGATAALESIGIIVKLGESEEDYGIACTRMPLGPLFLMAAKPFKTLEELRAENTALTAALPKEDAIQKPVPFELGAGWGG